MEPNERYTEEARETDSTTAREEAHGAAAGRGRGCLAQHLREAIRLNRERLPRYARLTDGASVSISRRLIRLERLALPGAWIIDRWARRWQRRGVPVVCADFVAMDAAPPFRARLKTAPAPVSRFEPPDPGTLRRRTVAAYRADGFPGVDRVLADALEATRAHPAYGCMLRHMLESMLRIARLAPEHARRSRAAGLAPPTRLSWLLIRTHLLLLGRAIDLDRRAAPLQARGIPILCRDVPPIPLPGALSGKTTGASARAPRDGCSDRGRSVPAGEAGRDASAASAREPRGTDSRAGRDDPSTEARP